MSSKSGIRNVLLATKPCTVWTSQLPHVLRTRCVLQVLTWTCASRHSGVHFLNISTCKSRVPTQTCFVHVDFEMCQRRALFEHLNFHKCCEHGVFCTFWFGNVLHATTMYIHFLKLSTYKSAQALSCLCILTSTCTSTPQRRARFEHLIFHNCSEHGVFCTFCLWHVLRAAAPCTFWTFQLPKVARQWTPYLPRWLGTRRFTEPTFRPSGATKHWKHRVVWLFYLFEFFLLPFSSLTLPTSALPYVHIVGSLTSKLPFVKSPASFVPDLLPVRMPTTWWTNRRGRVKKLEETAQVLPWRLEVQTSIWQLCCTAAVRTWQQWAKSLRSSETGQECGSSIRKVAKSIMF